MTEYILAKTGEYPPPPPLGFPMTLLGVGMGIILSQTLRFFIFIEKVAVPEGCEYVPLVQKATKPAKVGYFI